MSPGAVELEKNCRRSASQLAAANILDCCHSNGKKLKEEPF